jgi:hypothetical protein
MHGGKLIKIPSFQHFRFGCAMNFTPSQSKPPPRAGSLLSGEWENSKTCLFSSDLAPAKSN